MSNEKVRVTVLDPSGSTERQVGIPTSWTVERFIREFTRKLNFPNTDKHGNLISYEAVLKRTGDILDPMDTIKQAGIQEGDVIRLRLKQEGGGFDFNLLLKNFFESSLSEHAIIPDYLLERLMTLAEREDVFYQKRIAIFYLFGIYAILIVSTLTIIFLEGFHIYGFDIDDVLLKWLGVSILGEVAGLAVLVYGSLFKEGSKIKNEKHLE